MVHRIEVRPKAEFGDPHAAGVFSQVKELGIVGVTAVRSARLFFLYGDLSADDATRVAQDLLIDPVVEDFRFPIDDLRLSCEGPAGPSNADSSIANRQSSIVNVIEVHLKPGVMDPVAESTEQAIRDMGFAISSVRTARRYEVDGTLDDAQRESIARKLLANAVIEDVYYAAHTPAEIHAHSYEFKVTHVPIRDLDDAGLVKLAKEGDLFLNLTEMKAIQEYFRSLGREPRDVELEMIAQTWSEHCVHKTFRSDVAYSGSPLPGDWNLSFRAADAAELESLRADLRDTVLGAGYAGEYLDEHLAAVLHAAAGELAAGPVTITLHIDSRSELDRTVLVNGKKVVAFSWSNFGGDFRLRIPNLIKNTIFRATQELAKPWCVSVFKDNAGVIEFDNENAVCFKVETHNHPSALDPYGGAGTGIGGVVRDPMGTGMGARPVANTDVFCFGRPDMAIGEVPKGVLHPRRVMRGVVAGVRDYGNRMGIPTVNGAVYFDDRYIGNPLVFCGTVGLLPRDKCFKQVQPGDAILVVGGRTGRDGIHGATFSSGELTHEHETDFSNAVQIGNAITEKKMLDTILQARDQGLYTAITDCGAGGLSSAVGEMGEELGAQVHLDRVPLKYAGLSYSEIWISEAQERMVLSVPQENLEKILAIFRSEGVEATVIGHFGSGMAVSAMSSRVADVPSASSRDAGILPACGEAVPASHPVRCDVATAMNQDQPEQNAPVDRGQDARDTRGQDALVTRGRDARDTAKLRLFYAGTPVGELDMAFLHNGLPRPTKEARWEKRLAATLPPPARESYNATLLKVLSLPNVASKEWIIRQYDHEVQGGSALKPLVGAAEDAPGDAAVVRPVLASRKGVVVSCGMNPQLGDLDPYQSALHAIDEALRNAVAVGGNLEHTAILDNFCWGNCNKPDRMGALVQSAKACYDAAKAYGTPFVSGKDSLNNEFVTEGGQTIAIPPTLLISAISVVDDVARCVSSDAKEPGNFLFILGRTGGELGGSHYLLAEGAATGTDVPPVDLATNRRVMLALQSAIQAGTVRACHDLSEGGLAVAAAEMAFGGNLGVEIDLAAIPAAPNSAPTEAAALFAESAGRFLVEVAPAKYDAFLRLVQDVPYGELGKVTATGRVVVKSGGRKLVDLDAAKAKEAWQGTFRGF